MDLAYYKNIIEIGKKTYFVERVRWVVGMVGSILSIEYVIRADVDQKDSTLFALLCQILGKINVDCLRSDGIFFHHFGETNCNAVDDGVGFYVIQQGI